MKNIVAGEAKNVVNALGSLAPLHRLVPAGRSRLYIDLGDTERTLATPALGTILTETRRATDNIVRVGLNYKWGSGGYGGGY
jgi:hypothetical protein